MSNDWKPFLKEKKGVFTSIDKSKGCWTKAVGQHTEKLRNKIKSQGKFK